MIWVTNEIDDEIADISSNEPLADEEMYCSTLPTFMLFSNEEVKGWSDDNPFVITSTIDWIDDENDELIELSPPSPETNAVDVTLILFCVFGKNSTNSSNPPLTIFAT